MIFASTQGLTAFAFARETISGDQVEPSAISDMAIEIDQLISRPAAEINDLWLAMRVAQGAQIFFTSREFNGANRLCSMRVVPTGRFAVKKRRDSRLRQNGQVRLTEAGPPSKNLIKPVYLSVVVLENIRFTWVHTVYWLTDNSSAASARLRY